jgi:hypothetical protein
MQMRVRLGGSRRFADAGGRLARLGKLEQLQFEAEVDLAIVAIASIVGVSGTVS